MPRTIEKKEVIDIPEGKFLRVETKVSEDKKHVEVTLFYEVKTQEEIKAEERERRVAEEEERARRKAEEVAKERKEQEERERKETEAKLKKEAEEKAKKTKEKTENKTDEAENIEPTIDEYMAALSRTDEALKSLKEEERKFKERMHREAIPPQDLPIYWKKYSEACKEEYKLSEKVVYCGKKAKFWAEWGFRNIRKTWKIEECWREEVTSKYLLSRTIVWQGTLEEYCQNYDLHIYASQYTCNLRIFCGIALQNTPEKISERDRLEVTILD